MSKIYLTRNFKQSELACPCCGKCEMDPEFLTRLQVWRDLLGVPVSLASTAARPITGKSVESRDQCTCWVKRSIR